jgi:hypothetical protein
MPQVIVNNSEIATFSFTVKFDVRNLSIVFDISDTVFNGSGVSNCQGINFNVIDAGGVSQFSYNWSSPAIATPSTTANPQYLGESSFTLDLSSTFIYSLFFQKWRIKGAIRDGNGNTFETSISVYDLCMPEGFTDNGYVKGTFHVKLDCTKALITVKDMTNAVYRGAEPYNKTNEGTLYYPVGTISPVEFTDTPFSNDQVYTGNYRLVNTKIALFDLGNSGTIQVEYYTAENWDFDCENNIANVLCCIQELQALAEKNCNNAVGTNARQTLNDISTTLMTGVIKEMRGLDSSVEAKAIREKLRCDCGKKGVKRVSADPVNLAVYNIVIDGAGGTSVSSSINGATKNFIVSSDVYTVEKADLNDIAFSISVNSQTPNVVRYRLQFDYAAMAEYILNEIGGSPTLITQLNSLIESTFIDLSNLNGRCVIDIGASNYFLSFRVASAANTFNSIIIGSTTYTPPSPITVNNATAIEAYLNSLSLGVWQASYSSSPSGTFINIFSGNNSNTPVSASFTVSGTVVVRFQQTNKSLIAVLQALIDYMCDLTAAGVRLGQTITVCSIAQGSSSETVLSPTATQNQLNTAFALALCAVRNSILTFTTTTCDAIKAIFISRPSAVIGINGRIYGTNSSGLCTGFSLQQLALEIIDTIKSNSVVFNRYCSIPECGEPVSCPDIAGVTLQQLGNSIVLQFVNWSAFTTTTQTVTVRYRLQGNPTFTTVSTSLSVPSSGTVSPNFVVLTNPTIGAIYEVQVLNNCGGSGIIQTIETSVCPAPLSLQVAFVEETSPSALYTANVTWVGDPSGEYMVEYKLQSDSSWTEATGSPVTGLSLQIEGLEYGETYDVRVSRICDPSSSSGYAETDFIFEAENILITNNSAGFSISSVTEDGAAFITPISGSFPIAATETLAGDHSGITLGLEIIITGSGDPSSLILSKNGVYLDCENVSGAGTYNFAAEKELATDKLELILQVGSCF